MFGCRQRCFSRCPWGEGACRWKGALDPPVPPDSHEPPSPPSRLRPSMPGLSPPATHPNPATDRNRFLNSILPPATLPCLPARDPEGKRKETLVTGDLSGTRPPSTGMPMGRVLMGVPPVASSGSSPLRFWTRPAWWANQLSLRDREPLLPGNRHGVGPLSLELFCKEGFRGAVSRNWVRASSDMGGWVGYG